MSLSCGGLHRPDEFLLTAKRDAESAKRFFRKAFSGDGNPMTRVLNVDKNPAYTAAVRQLKAEGTLTRRVRLRQCRYLNNVVEQDHRTVKKRVWLAKGYGSFQSAWRTLQGIEAMNMIRKRAESEGWSKVRHLVRLSLLPSCLAWPHKLRKSSGRHNLRLRAFPFQRT